MSATADEPFPYFESSERNPLVLQRAYNGFLLGMVEQDIASIQESSRALYVSDVLLADEFGAFGGTLEDGIFDGNPNAYKRIARPIFETCVQSYIYSDVRVSVPPIQKAAEFLGVDKKQLRNMILPSGVLPLDIQTLEMSDEQRKFIEEWGLKAIIALEVNPWLLLRMHRLKHALGR